MSITKHEDGTIIIEGKEDTMRYQMLVWKQALKMEAAGLRFKGGRSVLAHVKRGLGIKGNRATVIAELEARLA